MNEEIKNVDYYGLIFKTTNLINNKLYIGQTTNILTWQKGKYKGSGCLISLAIKKYGFENFKCEFICYAYNQSELNNLEQFYIKEFNSLAPNGYNLMTGGGQLGKHHVLTKEKISQSNKGKGIGRKMHESAKKLMSIKSKGKVSVRCLATNKVIKITITEFNINKDKYSGITKGYKTSEITKQKMSKANKGKKLSKNHAKKISQSNKGKCKSYAHKQNLKGKLLNTITVKHFMTGEKLRIHKTDPRWLSGEYVGVTKGNKLTEEHKKKISRKLYYINKKY